MKRLMIAAVLIATGAAPALACDVQTESRGVSRLYQEKAASLPAETASRIGEGILAAGRLHELGKNKDACDQFARLRELLTADKATNRATNTAAAAH